ncbi:MAG: N-(5'-phosphoribosyl)anthranilate isomerase, partial [Candidatus Omnitrophica bacterium]|nr:N-(5'-phosphoribosyl)anthranilate isomerase [Candidatus Omnitrophota bacterium]MBD3268640.1 N-(5'-phosphoribosyl)anthranilate isomerase [Candidatus Omnitrophota bacterium]
MIKIKICGITNTEDALLASSLGADALGFIFTKKSPRFIEAKEAKKIIAKLGPLITRVGVFLDEQKEEAERVAVSLGLDVLQFHGAESPSYCSFFRKKFRVIKTLFPQNQNITRLVKSYKVDAFLLDIKLGEKKSGRKILDTSVLKEAKKIIEGGVKLIISAGLNPGNLD